jgi:PTH1 family peptidyl-tRNA hydrolase
LWAIVGLGNPGGRYAHTRHNVGFMVVQEIAGAFGISLNERRRYRVGRGSIEGGEVVLLEPSTFMNLSGLAVREAMRRFGVGPETLVVIHDDMDMETGRLKIRKTGSSGGHKGVQSIIEHIGTRDFVRVKIGIGRQPGIPPEKYVLSRFRRDETPALNDAIACAAEAVKEIIAGSVEGAMNRFNRKASASGTANGEGA